VRRCLPFIAAAALAACGNDRTQPLDVDRPVDPVGERTARLTEAGLRFRAPANWADVPVEGPRVGGIHSGLAMVAIWRYDRDQPLPRTTAELRRVRGLLLDAVRERDPEYAAESARLVRRAGAPGIELVGRQRISGRPAEVRSTHLFARGSEYVIDAYAPPEHFERVDRAVFRPLLRSLRIVRRG